MPRTRRPHRTPGAYSTEAWLASVERDQHRQPTVASQPPRIEVWQCRTCGGAWTEAGSYALGRCTRCGTERPLISALR